MYKVTQNIIAKANGTKSILRMFLDAFAVLLSPTPQRRKSLKTAYFALYGYICGKIYNEIAGQARNDGYRRGDLYGRPNGIAEQAPNYSNKNKSVI